MEYEDAVSDADSIPTPQFRLFPHDIIVQKRAVAALLVPKNPAACCAQNFRMDSRQGHDAFLVDMDRFRPAIASLF